MSQSEPMERQTTSPTTESRTLTLYVRSLAPAGLQSHHETVFERLDGLKAAGVIDDYSVRVWGKSVSPDAAEWTDSGQAIWEQLARFREWADDNDASLRSFFDEEAVHSELTGQTYTRVLLPTMTLAEYEGDELRFVAPCSDGETVHTVADRLDELTTLAESEVER
jgi:hypothetical protein